MNRFTYTLLFYLILPLVFLRLFWRSRFEPGYRGRWKERLGWYGDKPLQSQGKRFLVFHAVSVGEVHALEPLIEAVKKELPQYSLLVTTSTPTGSLRVRKLFRDRVEHVYLPYDLPGAVRRFLGRYKPEMIVLMETELWPNLIHHAEKSQVNVVLANARLSEKSRKSYARFPGMSQDMMSKLSWIAAQSESDQQRFVSLGLPALKSSVCGSLKYEGLPDEGILEKGRKLKQECLGGKQVIVAVSTREGEDELVLSAFDAVLQQVPNTALILVPRHLQRLDSAQSLAEGRGMHVVRASSLQGKPIQEKKADNSFQVLLGDTMGEMFMYLRAADIAFVGGSLVPTGCQNVLEPAALGLPIITGPSRFNFQAITDEMIEAGALIEVEDEAALARVWVSLVQDESKRLALGQNAKAEYQRNSGASQNVLACIMSILNQR